MKPIDKSRQGQEGEREFAFDEAFLEGVDRAMSVQKQADPYRLEEVRRAAHEESRLASLTNSYGIDRSSDRVGKQMT